MDSQYKLSKLKTVGELIRVKNCLIVFIGVWLGAALTFVGDTSSFLTKDVFSAAFAAALILGAGNAINDFFDYSIDKVNRPDRPLPSGRITKSDTLMLAIAMFLVGLGFSKSINFFALLIAFANSLILLLYAKYSKKLLFISNFTIAYLVFTVFLFGAVASFGDDASLSEFRQYPLIIILACCAFLMTLAREMIKDIEDMEGDKKAYAVTVPIRYGIKPTRQAAFLLTIAAVVLSFLPVLMSVSTFNLPVYLVFILLADTSFMLTFTMHPALAQRVMVTGMTLALVAFYAGLLL